MHHHLQAEKYVPPELKLVSLFGYTLGGFYLARYTDSPVGAFDEVRKHLHAHTHRSCVQLVAIAGIVWNWPTSSAWAARVYVNNRCGTCSVCVWMHHRYPVRRGTTA